MNSTRRITFNGLETTNFSSKSALHDFLNVNQKGIQSLMRNFLKNEKLVGSVFPLSTADYVRFD